PVPRTVDALLKLCHDALALAAGGAARYFPAGSMPSGARIPSLLEWQAELLRVASHDEHPWHEGLLAESLLAQARRALTLQ
ncbi:MAG: DNA polymerase III subunit delta', partial [Rubrivivax sp.]